MRYLLVGLGNIGQKRKQLLGERCVATADPYNASADYANASDCPLTDFDAVILSVPNQTKLDLLEYFLKHGKQVLVEKPLLLPDRARAERLERLAQHNGAIWYTSYNHRFEPLVARLKKLLDADRVGRVYHSRFFYGNGTVRNVIGSWRDQGLGVLEDLGSHLLDLSGFLLDDRARFEPWSLESHEASSLDHCILASPDHHIVLEASFVCWKNTFSIDVFGERGSLHVQGLPKWGPAQLVLRERVYPSGAPTETVETAEQGADVTWAADLEYFEQQVKTGRSSMDNDLWISQTLHGLAPP